MDTDIAPTSLASGRTVPIGAECGGGVHDTPPGCAWQHGHEEYVWTPVWFTTSPHHGLVWSYRMGKTTLIRSIIGFTPPRRGQLWFKGVEITHLPAYRIAQMGMGIIPQGRRIFPSLSVR